MSWFKVATSSLRCSCLAVFLGGQKSDKQAFCWLVSQARPLAYPCPSSDTRWLRADRRGQQVVPLAKQITVVVVGSLAQTWQTKQRHSYCDNPAKRPQVVWVLCRISVDGRRQMPVLDQLGPFERCRFCRDQTLSRRSGRPLPEKAP